MLLVRENSERLENEWHNTQNIWKMTINKVVVWDVRRVAVGAYHEP